MKKTTLRKITSFFLALAMLASLTVLLPFTSSAEGTPDLTISTPDELVAFASDTNTYNGKLVVLGADIDMTGKTYTSHTTQFMGTFDGQGYTISNLTITGGGRALIKTLNGGTVKNLNMDTVAIDTVMNVGAVVSEVKISGAFENVHVKNGNFNITNKSAGGIVGLVGVENYYASNATFTNCSFTGTITTADDKWGVGGIVGRVYNYNGTPSTVVMTDCAANATLSGAGRVGGMIGAVEGTATLNRCAFNGSVSEKKDTGTTENFVGAGGIIGHVSKDCTLTLMDCVASGTVTGNGAYAGGIIGYSQSGATLTRCVSLSTVTATNHSGLFTGYTDRTSTWDAAKAALDANPSADISAFVPTVTLTDCYSVDRAIWRHTNRYFSCFYFVITNSDGSEPAAVPTQYNGYNAGGNPTDSNQLNNDFSAPVNKITTPLDFSAMTLLKNWVQTGDGELLPAGLAKVLDKSPITVDDIYYQQSLTENANGTVNIRFVVVVDDLRYAEVGINLQAMRDADIPENTEIIPISTTTVYRSVIANGETVTAESLGGKYVFAVVITNVKYQDFAHTFTVSAYAKMQDGTVLTSASADAQVAKKA